MRGKVLYMIGKGLRKSQISINYMSLELLPINLNVKISCVYQMSKKIFLIAGEPSGDTLGAGIMRELKANSSEPIEFVGVGGPLMEAEGMNSLLPMGDLCVMGIWEVIWQLPRLIKLINGMVVEIENAKPDAVITIDLPDFNFQVVQKLKKREICQAKMIHYVSPSVWAWRPGRAKKISEFYDQILCLFPFEPKYYDELDVHADFVGHPLVEAAHDYNGDEFRAQHGLEKEDLVLGLFLGSREAELKAHSEVLKQAVQIVKEQYPDIQVVVPTPPDFEYNVLKVLEGWEVDCKIVSSPDLKWDAFAACNYAVAVSGTVGLEIAYMGIPHVVAYKAHPITALAVKTLIKVRFVHLANILMDKAIVPEYLQGKCDSVKIAKGLLILMKRDEVREKQLTELRKLGSMLQPVGADNPSQKAAKTVLALLQGGAAASEEENVTHDPQVERKGAL